MKALLLLGVGAVFGIRDDILDLQHRRPDQFSRVSIFNKPKRSHIARKRRSPEHVKRQKRDDGACPGFDLENMKKDNVVTRFPLGNDTNPTIALVWTGDQGHLLAITTYESFVAYPSKLYRSTDGGRTFVDITSKIHNEYIRRKTGALTATSDSSFVILIVNNHPLGFSETSDIYVSRDTGATWSRKTVPFEMSGSMLRFHHSDPTHILATDAQSQQLFITTDFCDSWKAVHDSGRTHTYKWDPKDDNIFYYTHDPLGTGRRDRFSMTLYKSSDGGKSTKALTEHVWSFGIQEEFLYVSVRYMPENADAPSRIMHVSTDHGESFHAVQLPAISPEQFYSILDASENMIFMHVDDEGDTGKGSIYVSDDSGVVFSKSLANNLYPNGDDVTDFIKIDSLAGVYLTSQLKEDQSIESLITFDKGATWDILGTPSNCQKGNENSECGCNRTTDSFCHLQIHCAFSQIKGVAVPEMPYSTEDAPGLIFAHGNVGDGLSTDAPDLFVSSDGGYKWIRSLEGPHKTLIGDSGAVVWAVTDDDMIDTIKFSFDEGQCWNEYKFSDKKITITGLVAEPGEKATDVAIWGWDDDQNNWVVFTFDFKSVMKNECGDSDYEPWYAHEDIKLKDNTQEGGCQLGRKIKYQRLKKDSICYQSKTYKPSTEQKSCVCTVYDFLCDFGYVRNGDQPDCVADPQFGQKGHSDICIDDIEEEIISKGYKKIPGDKCDESSLSQDKKEKFFHQEKKLKKKCPKQVEVPDDYGMKDSSSWQDWFDIEDADNLMKPEKSSKGSWWGALSVILICSLSGVAVYFYRKSQSTVSVVSYQNFTNDDVPRIDAGAEGGSATAGEFRDDSSDEDNDMITA